MNGSDRLVTLSRRGIVSCAKAEMYLAATAQMYPGHLRATNSSSFVWTDEVFLHTKSLLFSVLEPCDEHRPYFLANRVYSVAFALLRRGSKSNVQFLRQVT